ncbi:MAG: LysM peptidoglycan-binding domain-containing protein [Victivallales bacterium]|nr:LysM peptidoglycan-binding domain-containing protein [Victivallales bacterium]
MRFYICLPVLALLAVAAGCAPHLAETPLGNEEKRWEEYIRKSYPGWKSPQTIPPAVSDTKVENPAVEPGKPQPFKGDAMVIEDVIVKDKTGAVTSETITAVEVKEKGRVYIVQKNDTLWKIARKVYNDGSKWRNIQSANQDVLKGSDKVLPGMTLQIPAL